MSKICLQAQLDPGLKQCPQEAVIILGRVFLCDGCAHAGKDKSQELNHMEKFPAVQAKSDDSLLFVCPILTQSLFTVTLAAPS